MVAILLLVLGVILLLIIMVAVYIFKTQRQLVNLDELCKNAMSQIAVQLNSRWDAVLALAKLAGQYAKHESETMVKTIEARRQAQVNTAEDVMQQQGELTQIMGRLMAIGEAYPDLKANQNFLQLQTEIADIENKIAAVRRYFNTATRELNNAVQTFPSNILAGMFGFKKEPMFEIPQEDRATIEKAPEIKF